MKNKYELFITLIIAVIMKNLVHVIIIEIYLIQIMLCFVIKTNCVETNKLQSWISLRRKYSFLYNKLGINEAIIESHSLFQKDIVLKNNGDSYNLELLETDLIDPKWKIDDTEDMINSKCRYHAIKRERVDRFPHYIVHHICNGDLNHKESEYKCTQIKKYSLVLKRKIDKNGNEFWKEGVEVVNSGCLSMHQQSIIIGSTKS